VGTTAAETATCWKRSNTLSIQEERFTRKKKCPNPKFEELVVRTLEEKDVVIEDLQQRLHARNAELEKNWLTTPPASWLPNPAAAGHWNQSIDFYQSDEDQGITVHQIPQVRKSMTLRHQNKTVY